MARKTKSISMRKILKTQANISTCIPGWSWLFLVIVVILADHNQTFKKFLQYGQFQKLLKLDQSGSRIFTVSTGPNILHYQRFKNFTLWTIQELIKFKTIQNFCHFWPFKKFYIQRQSRSFTFSANQEFFCCWLLQNIYILHNSRNYFIATNPKFLQSWIFNFLYSEIWTYWTIQEFLLSRPFQNLLHSRPF